METIDARVASLIDVEKTKSSTVLIVGAGSLGSRVATELARCFVGHFLLFDPGELRAVNVARHIGGHSSVGRKKVEIVQDALLDIYPDTKVAVFPFASLKKKAAGDFVDEPRFVESTQGLSRRPDLLVDATGDYRVADQLSVLASEWKVPATFATIYEKGVGGYAQLFVPPDDPCHTCTFGFQSGVQEAGDRGGGALEGIYTRNPKALMAEPSLSTSIWPIVVLQVRFALEAIATPDGEKDPDRPILSPLPSHLIFWSNFAPLEGPWKNMFNEPLMSYPVPRDELLARKVVSCVSCGRSAGQ